MSFFCGCRNGKTFSSLTSKTGGLPYGKNYLGNGNIASHTSFKWNSPWDMGAPNANHRFIHILSGNKLDLVFLIDTTGSMWDDIGQVKLSANEIVDTLDAKGFDWRVAVADYKDYPQWPYGEPTDYVYKRDLPFTTKDNKPAIVQAINGLSAYGGADTPEAVYSALVNTMTDKCKDCINNADNFGWRKGVTKVIIQMGDAPPHMPVEPWPGGYSLNDVISTSKSIDPVIVYSVAIGSDRTAYSAFSEIANGTGGKVYTSPTASDIVDTLIEVIGDIGKPTTNYGVSVNITLP